MGFSVVGGGTSGSSSPVTTAAGTTAASGSTFLICMTDGGAVTSVTDNKGNTYTQVRYQQTDSYGTGPRIYKCENGTGGAGHTATVNSTTNNYNHVWLIELTGVLTSSVEDTAAGAGANDTVSPYTVTSGTLAQADNIVLVNFSSDASTQTASDNGSGFTLIAEESDGANFWTGGVFAKTVSSTSAVTLSMLCPTGQSNVGMALAVFKLAGGGGPSPVTVDLGVTDTADTMAATAAATVGVNLARTDAADTLSAASTSPVTVSLARTDAADTLAATTTMPVTVAHAATDAADTVASTASVRVTANLSATDASDTLAATAVIGDAPVTVDVAATDAADTLTGTAAVRVSADLASTDAPDTLAATAALPVVVALAATDAADSLAATAAARISVGLVATDETDTLDALVLTAPLSEITVALAVTDEPDTLSATLTHEQDQRGHGGRNAGPMDWRLYDDVPAPMSVRLAVTDEDDTLSASVVPEWVRCVVSVRIEDEADMLQASVEVAPWPELQLMRENRLVRDHLAGVWAPTRRARAAARPQR